MHSTYPHYRLSIRTTKVIYQKRKDKLREISDTEARLYAKLRFIDWVKYLTQSKSFSNFLSEAADKRYNKLLARQTFEQNVANIIKQRCKGCNTKLYPEESKLSPYCSDCVYENSVNYPK